MDNVRPRGSYSPIKRSYYTKPAFRPKDLKQDVKTFGIKNMTTAGTRAVVNTGKGKMENDLKKSKACWVWRPKLKVLDHDSKNSGSYILLVVYHTTNGHQFTMSNRLQELASPKQTVLSKANGLGKDFPNPFMAGSLPKTIKQSNDPPLSRGYTLGSGEDSLELMELMANCTQIVCFVRKKNREIHLKLEDAEGISLLTNEEIFEQLAYMGNNIATAIICLAISRRFNFSKFIFEAMVKNLDSPHKFLLYPRFIQLLFNKQQSLLLPHTRTYPTPTLTSKLFSNMRRASKGYSGVVTPLFESMLVQVRDEEQQQSPSRITSSPSLYPLPTQPSLSPEPIQPTHEAEETISMPHDSPLHAVHSHGSAEVLSVKKLEYKLKSGKARRKAKIVLSDDEEIAEDSSKQGRKISQIDEDPTISLVQDEGISWIQQEAEVHEKPSEMEISIANPPKVTKVSTAEAHVYTRRSAKDKGKAIMEEPATPKKVKKRTQVQLSMDEELARKMEEEERARFNAKQETRALQEEEEERKRI
ncbi:hypothetical protein Tco_0812527 [Tanacetum coccineum]